MEQQYKEIQIILQEIIGLINNITSKKTSENIRNSKEISGDIRIFKETLEDIRIFEKDVRRYEDL